jgi:hypothetical protein
LRCAPSDSQSRRTRWTQSCGSTTGTTAGASSGVITVRNLRRIAKDLGEDVDDDELIAMIDEFDQNGDGVIDEKEFLAIMSKGADAGLVED